ncbi:hypothetical protein BDW22DRAFT_1363295 [Trametopsis cervina]|nr:hypothetical protein BDW22DRAFT_1363295 [Trametopsis cervina]
MSQDQSALTPISVLEQLQAGFYISVATSTLFVYDCIITLGREIDMIWKRHYSLGTMLFALTRYTTILVSSTELIGNFIHITSSRSCVAIMIAMDTLSAIQFLSYAVFTAFRAYSLLQGTNCKLLLSGTICALSLMPFAANIVRIPTNHNLVDQR